MFTRHHEQELAEIKALTYELGQRFQEVLEQLEDVKKALDQLGSQDELATTGKRKAGRVKAKAVDGTPGPMAAGAKKARSRKPSTPVVGASKPGKRRRKATTRSASNPPKQTTKPKRRRVITLGSSGSTPDGGAAWKRPQPAEPAPSSGSDEA